MSNEPVTLTNPETGETWTSGKRGRLPKWVEVMRDNGTVIPRATPTKETVLETPAVPGALKVWKYIGQAGETGDNDKHQVTARIIIVAASPSEAMIVANRTFQNHMSKSELDVMWREETDKTIVADIHAAGINVTQPAIWQSVGKVWEIRKPLLSATA